ncbi:MAG: CapA family protein, partial [bacterium]|nr:CapA family protein [bacterium]
PEIIAHKNSVDFLSFDSVQGKPDAEETTSYFSVIFAAPPLAPLTTEPAFPEFNAKTVLLVGDIMLGRYVETLMKKNDNFYPFRKIDNFLKGTDIVFGNLEGPIVENPPKFPSDSLKFAFPPAVTEALSFVKFNLFSLANNHTLDAGTAGLAKTKKFLEKTGINFVGDPIKCSEDFLFEKDNLIFLAINKTYPFNCSNEEISRVIKSVKSARPENFLVVSIHWGEEYSPKSSASQQELARQMIEAGADAIFGHHPHVVQEIEIYKNKLIFYSLGNFVFDQYFSKETQEGLAVGLEIWPKKTIFRLFPIKLPLSQPLLMNHKEAGEFLKKLAKKSSTALAEKIKSGLIEN